MQTFDMNQRVQRKNDIRFIGRINAPYVRDGRYEVRWDTGSVTQESADCLVAVVDLELVRAWPTEADWEVIKSVMLEWGGCGDARPIGRSPGNGHPVYRFTSTPAQIASLLAWYHQCDPGVDVVARVE